MLKHQIGRLSYPIESDDSRFQLASCQIKKLVNLIDNEKTEAAFRSVNESSMDSPKREKFLSARRFSGFLERQDSFAMRSISNAEEVYLDRDDGEVENF